MDPSIAPDRVTSAPSPRTVRTVAWSSFLGTTIEWYDYFIYGAAAALVLGPQFFPSDNPVNTTLAAFASFAVGFVARPIGGLVMGHFGDRVGRKAMLVLSMFLMGAATLGIGLLPNYAVIGIWAPILLVVFRLVQGFGVGGEWGGAVLMAIEHAPKNRKTLFGTFPQLGNPAGTVLSSASFLGIIAFFGTETFTEWAWRLPFLFSVVLLVIGFVIRLKVTESPEFTALVTEGETVRTPLLHTLRHYGGRTLAGIGLSIIAPLMGNMIAVWVLSYGTTTLQVPQITMTGIVIITATIWMILLLVAAFLADRFSPRIVFVVGAICLALWIFPFFALLNTADPALMLLAMAGISPGVAGVFGPLPAILSGMFPVRVRFSAISIGFQIGSILGGGLIPLVATGLLAATGTTASIAAYILGVTAVSVSSLLVAGILQHRAAGRTPVGTLGEEQAPRSKRPRA